LSHQDIQLAKQLLALTPSSQSSSNIANEHGVDIILGGHDHLYFVGRGVDGWDNYNLSKHVLGAEEDKGDVLVIKSGTDFRDISEICLELEDNPEGSARKKLIGRITGKCTGLVKE
jgi:5'-nucleotidase